MDCFIKPPSLLSQSFMLHQLPHFWAAICQFSQMNMNDDQDQSSINESIFKKHNCIYA